MSLQFQTETIGHNITNYLLALPGCPVIRHIHDIDNGDPHDHHFGFSTLICFGGYVEEVYTIQPDGSWTMETIRRERGHARHVSAFQIHRIVELPEGECITASTPYHKEHESSFYQMREGVLFRRPWNATEWTAYNDWPDMEKALARGL